MKHFYKLIGVLTVTAVSLLPSAKLIAGNPDRSGQAGATELLINPWARSSGWGGAGSGSVRGVEAIFGNVAGIAGTKRTEIEFSHSIWMKGSTMGINALGLTQKVGEGSV